MANRKQTVSRSSTVKKGPPSRSSDVRREEVALLEKGIINGKYRVDGKQVARAMIFRASLRRK